MLTKYLICLILLLNHCLVLSNEIATELGLGLGMANVSYTENASQLDSSTTTGPASGSVSIIGANIYYKFYPLNDNMAYYFNGVVPMMASSGNSYFNFGAGLEYYFGGSGHKMVAHKKDFEMIKIKKFRYYALIEAGISYMAYTTEVARRNDTFFELGGGGGINYSLSDWYGIKATAQVMRGVGVLTTPFVIKFFASFVYYLDPANENDKKN